LKTDKKGNGQSEEALKTQTQLESAQPNWRRSGAARWMMILMALLAAAPVMAQQPRVYREGRSWVEESTGNIQPVPRQVRVVAGIGNIKVQGGSQNFTWTVKKRTYASTEQEARRQFERLRISAKKINDQGIIETSWTGGRSSRFSTEITVLVPREMELVHLDTNGGNLAVTGTTAKIDVETQGGNIALDDIGGAVRAQTAGGNVVIGSIDSDLLLKSGGGNISIKRAGGRVQLNTAGGNVVIGSADAVSVETMGGSVEVGKSNNDVTVKTAGGSVVLGEIGGKATVQTGGGNIRVGTAKGRVSAITTGGNIELFRLWQGALAQSGAGCIRAEFLGGRGGFTDSSLRTAAGDVTVYLNTSAPVTVHAASEMTSGMGVRTDFPELKVTTEGGEYGPKSMFVDGTLNGGGPLLKVRTTIGQIEIRKGK
jgi:hypothetical protein